MNTTDKCKNCGGDYGLHQYQTNLCPVGGREAPFGRKQEWKTTTFEAESENPNIANLNDMQTRLYRLNEQHVEDLLARQELLDVCKQIVEDAFDAAHRNPNYQITWASLNKAKAAIQKWSQK